MLARSLRRKKAGFPVLIHAGGDQHNMPVGRSRSGFAGGMNRNYHTVKRLMDLFICLTAAPFLLVIGIVLAIAIRINSPGPVFFFQKRVGKGSRLFSLIKFRTMHKDFNDLAHREFMQAYVNGRVQEARSPDGTFKPFQEDQLTGLGRFLRKTSLDELPQLINVVKGEMSLVGPRPNVCWEVQAYQPWHLKRLDVLPGITGLAQIRGRSRITFDEIVRHDLEYINKRCLLLDLKILWWTAAQVGLGRGAE